MPTLLCQSHDMLNGVALQFFAAVFAASIRPGGSGEGAEQFKNIVEAG